MVVIPRSSVRDAAERGAGAAGAVLPRAPRGRASASTAATATRRSTSRRSRASRPTKTCMNCHSQIWNQSPTLEPVRASWRTGAVDRVGEGPRPARLRLLQPQRAREQGRRLHHLPRAASTRCRYVWQEKSLLMEWCLDCHRQPEKYLRPKSEVYNIAYAAARRPARARAAGSWRNTRSRRRPPAPRATDEPGTRPRRPRRARRACAAGWRAPRPPPLLEEPRRARRHARRSSSSCTGSSPSRPRSSRTRRAGASS